MGVSFWTTKAPAFKTMATIFLFALIALTFGRSTFKEEAERSGAPFKWDNCDNGDGTVQAAVAVGVTLSSANFTSVGITLERKTLGVWVEIPCVEKIGSCTYEGSDICQQLAEHAAENCPKVKPYGIPCQCPFPAGNYRSPAGGITVPTKNPGLSWLTNGDYYVKAVLQTTQKEKACVEIYASLST